MIITVMRENFEIVNGDTLLDGNVDLCFRVTYTFYPPSPIPKWDCPKSMN